MPPTFQGTQFFEGTFGDADQLISTGIKLRLRDEPDNPVRDSDSAASIMPVLSQAACGSYSGSERGSMLLRVTSINCSGLGIYSAASIMPGASHGASALTLPVAGSMRLLFRVREREHAAVICLKRLRKVTSRS